MNKQNMNLMYTPTPDATEAATSDSDEQVTIPVPETVMRVFESGFQTYSGIRSIGGERKKTFNNLPLLPANSRSAMKALFDMEKLKKYVTPIVASKAPVYIDKLCVKAKLEEYINDHFVQFNFLVPATVVKGSFKDELNSKYTTKVLFSKKHRSATVGFSKILLPEGVYFYDLLTQKAKDALEGVNSYETALSFYAEYGTSFFYEVNVGAYVALTESVILMHSTEKRDIELKLGAGGLFGAGAGGMVSVDFGDFSQTMNFSSVGGDPSKSEDLTGGYGASAFEKPDVISYKTQMIYKLLDPNTELRKCMEDAYFTLMALYNDDLPPYESITSLLPGLYTVNYLWENTNWIPMDAEKLTVVLLHKGEVVDKIVYNRNDAFAWCAKVRKPGSNFGQDWSGDGHFHSDKRLGPGSLSLLYAKL